MIWEKDGSSLEIRTQGQLPDKRPALDEIVASGAVVHLEQMGSKTLRVWTSLAGRKLDGPDKNDFGASLRGHCCPRRDRPVAWPAENTRLGGTPVGYLGGGLRIKVAQPVQVIPKPG